MTAGQVQLPRRPTASRRLITVTVLLTIAILSVWLLIAAGLGAGRPGDASVPSLLPEAPAVVEVRQSAITEPVPLPGPELVPADTGRSPR